MYYYKNKLGTPPLLLTIKTNTYLQAKGNTYTFLQKLHHSFLNVSPFPIFETFSGLNYTTITLSEDMVYPNKSYQLFCTTDEFFETFLLI